MRIVQPTKEKIISNPTAGIPMLIMGIILAPVLIGVFILIGLTMVKPNQGKIVLLFGNYIGTINQPGLWWVNPFTSAAQFRCA